MRISFFVSILTTFLLWGCVTSRTQWSGKNESERISNFFERVFNDEIAFSPETLTYLGIKKNYGKLDSRTEAFALAGLERNKKYLSQLKEFKFEELSEQAQLSYQLFELQTQQSIEDWKWRDYTYSVNQMFGVQSGLPSFMMNMHQVKNEQDLKDFISRLNEFQRVFSEVVENIKRSEKKGILPPKFVFSKVIDDSKNIITGNPFDQSAKDSPLLTNFKRKMAKLNLKKGKKNYYLQKVNLALTTSVKVGYEKLIATLKDQETRSTSQYGAWKFPQGDEYYKNRLRRMTTTNYSPDFIHKLGLMNVDRIHGEMKEVMKKVAYKGSLKDFFKYVQKNPRFYFGQNISGRQAYMKLASKYIDGMRAKLDSLFLTKPKAALEVKAVEAFREKSAGMAFYESPAIDGSRPGAYYVNLSNLKALPKWEAEALAYHEAIPGHHMQLSIAQEMKSLPQFRRHGRFTAYTEGWGLYSERVPKEIGHYSDPYSDFGRLSMELVRACRLVVDTGLHSKKWTRDQAITFLDNNTPGDHNDNIRQINRYIVMPGQATAYMVGMLKILELRDRAKRILGAKFDIRKFHDVVLRNGAVPLNFLENLVNKFITEQGGKLKAKPEAQASTKGK